MAGDKDIFALRREQLLVHMQGTGALKTESVANAFRNVKREFFMREVDKESAYADTAISIGFGQTISQPSTIAVMLEMLSAGQGQTVLEVGSGCGYALALLSEIVGSEGKVFGIEFIDELKAVAEKNLKDAAGSDARTYKNIKISTGDGTLGLKEQAPFDRILVSAGCPYIPRPLFDQLREGGRVVAPVGDRYSQMMQSMAKVKGKPLKGEYPYGCFVFVPLRGKYGWDGQDFGGAGGVV